MSSSADPADAGGEVFGDTQWGLVAAAADPNSPDWRDALDWLCRRYWRPLYAYIRRHGHGPHDAEDLTQSFLAWLIQSDHLRAADPSRGRFRSFLLVRLKHFLGDERKKVHAQRRGGGRPLIPLEELHDLETGMEEPRSEMTPDRLFDRHWAMAVCERASRRLEEEYAAAGRAELFAQLQQFRAGEISEDSYREVAGRLGVSESSVKSAVFRLRRRQVELLREAVRRTVSHPGEVEDELRHLVEALGGCPPASGAGR